MGCLRILFFGMIALVALLLWQIPHVGPVLALALVIGAIWLQRLVRNTPATAEGGADVPAASPDLPPAVRLASRGRQGVAGEAYYAKHISGVVGRRRVPPAGEWDAGLRVTAYLDREPTNKHDRNAVRVRMVADGQLGTVGYLPADAAAAWQAPLRSIERRGALASCPAAIFRQQGGRQHYVIVLRLSSPDRALMTNDLPEGATILDAERECAVTGEHHHQDTVGSTERLSWATLHPSVVSSGKSVGEATLEARIDGETVGTLTVAQGQRYWQVLSAGQLVACEAEVFHGTRNMEVRLFLPRVD